jgi:7-cyano-7-deazaguanine synthase
MVSSAKKSIVLVSGGMDSCVCATREAQAGPTAFIHFNYGQRTERKELACFHRIARRLGVSETLVVDLSALSKIGGTTLLRGRGRIPPPKFQKGEIPSTYVPFRNGIMLSYAAAWAEVIGATRLVIGAVEADSSGYPDCRREFVSAFSRAVSLGTRTGLRLTVEAPLVGMTKAGIVRLGTKLGAPFGLTWSCYSSEKTACGRCESCVLRLRGFEQASVRDPIRYR